jgi:ubiquinone/menaquinone biosynthesis C-methylase UbiE
MKFCRFGGGIVERHSEKFNGKSALYANYRPNYPNDLIEKMIKEYQLNENSTIADIGSGTGIMTQQLLSFDLNVYSVEPNTEMRIKAENSLHNNENFTSIEGTAEQTTLDTNSIDFIIVAQAFHWFDREKFREECQRILRAGGKVMIIANNRIEDSPIIQEIISVYHKYCPEFCGFSNGLGDSNKVFDHFFPNSYKVYRMNNPLTYDKNGFIGRHMSASYAPNLSDKNYSLLVSEFSRIFDRYEEDGFITLPNETIGRCGEI